MVNPRSDGGECGCSLGRPFLLHKGRWHLAVADHVPLRKNTTVPCRAFGGGKCDRGGSTPLPCVRGDRGKQVISVFSLSSTYDKLYSTKKILYIPHNFVGPGPSSTGTYFNISFSLFGNLVLRVLRCVPSRMNPKIRLSFIKGALLQMS
jgi:hypothetical protein